MPDSLERLSILAAPLIVGLGQDDLGWHVTAAEADPGAVLLMASAVPELGPAYAGLHRDIHEDSRHGIPGGMQVVDSLLRGIQPGHGDIPDHILAVSERPPRDPLGDMRGLLVHEVRGLHRRQPRDIRYEPSPAHLLLDVIRIDGQEPREVDAGMLA